MNSADPTASASNSCRVRSRHVTSCPRLRNQAAGDTNPKGCRPNSYVEIKTIFIVASSHRGNNAHAPLTAGARCALYYDFNIATQQRQELHEPFRSKPPTLPSHHTPNLGLVNFQN